MPIIDKSFHERHFGGPHGLGDPEDRSLRKVEKDVLITKKMRDRAREEKCIKEVDAFNKCCIATGFSMVFRCRKENEELKACLSKWYLDEEFKKECTAEYLAERSEYRRTGIGKKQREARVANTI